MKLHVSRKNTKIGQIANLSLPPIQTCSPGVPCQTKCYALKAWRQYQATRDAWTENLQYYRHDPTGYFDDVCRFLFDYQGSHFRWHVAGDAPDQHYADEMMATAMLFKRIRFLAFTKAPWDWTGRPANLSVVQSLWPNWGAPNPLLPHAWLAPDPRIPATATACSGHCDSCLLCWELQAHQDVWFHLH